MPLWHKIKLLYSLLFQAVFLPSTEDLNKMVSELVVKVNHEKLRCLMPNFEVHTYLKSEKKYHVILV